MPRAEPAPARRPPAPGGRGYTVAPVTGIRVAGVPADALAELRFTSTWQRVDEVLSLTDRLARDGAALSDELYPVIGALSGSALKPLVVALRRAVFTGRRPGSRCLRPEVVEALGEDLARRVGEFLALRDRIAAVREGLPAVLDEERSRTTAALRRAAGGEAFRRGLALGSPVLAARVDAWLGGACDRVPDRSELLRLAKYLSRAAAKTSPFASFTLSGFGEWAPDGPCVQPAARLDWRGVAETERMVLKPLWDLLSARPGLFEHARLRVNPTVVDGGDKIFFLGTDRSEQVRSIPASPGVRAVLDDIRRRPGRPAATTPAARALVEAGLLELTPPYDEQAEDPFDSLAGWVAEAGGTSTASLVGGLAGTSVGRGLLTNGDRRRIATVRAAVTELLPRQTSMPSWVVDKALHVETGVLLHSAGRCSAPAWQAACDDLDVVRRALGVFDSDLPVKVLARHWFLTRYGRRATVPFLTAYRDLFSSGGADGVLGPLRELLRDPLGSPVVPLSEEVAKATGTAAVRAARREFWNLARQVTAGGDVVRARPGDVETFLAGLPRFIRPPGSVACYVQPVTGADGLRLVLALATAGYGRGLSRTHRLIRLAGGEVPAVDALAAPPTGADLLECRTARTGGLDLRPCLADRVLAYPGVTRTEPDGAGPCPAQTLPGELRIRYDPGTDRLILLDGSSRPLKPVHLGVAAQYWLPPAWHFLVRVFGEPAVVMIPGWALRPVDDAPEPGTVDRLPRVDIGRVTIVRACARLRAGDFPVPGGGEPETAFLLRLAAWLAGHGLPRRFFARVLALGDDRGAGLLSKSRKPVYVDVTDHALLTGFVRSLRDPDALLVIEEVLPDPGQAPCYGDSGRRVTEYVVQLSETGGPR
jgi:hypothetical protein